MKNPQLSAPRRSLLSLFCIGISTPLVASPAAESTTPSASTAEAGAPKTHIMYLGADFSVQWAGQLRPVQDVQGSSFVVAVDGDPVVVPSRNTDLQIKMDDTLKISTRSVTISGFKAERTYTPANNPTRQMSDSIARSNLAAAAVDAADAEFRTSESSIGLAGANATDGLGHSTPRPVEPSQLATEVAGIESSGFSANLSLNTVAEGALREGEVRSQELYDALYLSFEISAPKPLAKPYAVVVTRYREQLDKPDSKRIWIYAQALPTVDTKPAKIRFFRGGFPRGYLLDDVQVHVYDHQGEMASNLAKKQLSITEEEAFQFAIVDYIGQHRGATARPVLIKQPSAAELRSQFSAEKLARTFYVKLGKDGKPVGAFADAACAQRISDSDVETVVLALRFYPALEKGKAVEAAVPVHLGASKL